MSRLNKQQKYILGVIIAVVIIAGVAWCVKLVVKSRRPALQQTAQTTQKTEPQIAVKDIDNSQLPPNLPANLPLESGATILQNYQTEGPSGNRLQSTRVYVSKKSIDQVYASYQSFFTGNGWVITASVDQASLKDLVATKDAARMEIMITKNASGQVTVNVNEME